MLHPICFIDHRISYCLPYLQVKKLLQNTNVPHNWTEVSKPTTDYPHSIGVEKSQTYKTKPPAINKTLENTIKSSVQVSVTPIPFFFCVEAVYPANATYISII